MASSGKRVILAREARGYATGEAFADAIGIHQGTISRIETGFIKNSKYLVPIAKFLGVSPYWITCKEGTDDKIIYDSESGLNKDSIGITTMGRVTVRGIVEASNWAEACEWSEDQQYKIPILMPDGAEPPYDLDKLFGLEVRGDSMDIEYKPGWVVVCISVHDDPSTWGDGDNVIVRRGSSQGCEVTVKKLRVNKLTGKYELHYHSSNPNYQGLVLPLFNLKGPHTIDNVTISVVARVVYHIPTWATKPTERKKL